MTAQLPKNTSSNGVLETKKFLDKITLNNALATNFNILQEDFDIETAKQDSDNALSALGINSSLQAMLASQMLTINQLQHSCATFANNLSHTQASQYYTNTAIKLANTFVQQANLFAKLQGISGQRVVVEKVNISEGGQAIIGTVSSTVTAERKKK